MLKDTSSDTAVCADFEYVFIFWLNIKCGLKNLLLLPKTDLVLGKTTFLSIGNKREKKDT